MGIVPLSKTADGETGNVEQDKDENGSGHLLTFAAAGSLVAGAALLLSGCRRSGLLATVVGTALAMIDQQETVRVWWNALPVYLDEAQSLLGRVQGAVDDVTAQQQKVREVFSKAAHAVQV